MPDNCDRSGRSSGDRQTSAPLAVCEAGGRADRSAGSGSTIGARPNDRGQRREGPQSDGRSAGPPDPRPCSSARAGEARYIDHTGTQRGIFRRSAAPKAPGPKSCRPLSPRGFGPFTPGSLTNGVPFVFDWKIRLSMKSPGLNRPWRLLMWRWSGSFESPIVNLLPPTPYPKPNHTTEPSHTTSTRLPATRIPTDITTIDTIPHFCGPLLLGTKKPTQLASQVGKRR